MRSITVLLALFVVAIATQAQTAQIQFVNNSADPSAASADFWIDDQQVDDINFRFSSAYIDVTASVEHRVGIAPGTSTSSSEATFYKQLSFEAGKKYLVVATGVFNPVEFLANPAGAAIDFAFIVIEVPSTVPPVGSTHVLFMQGATDAPVMDIASGTTTLASNLAYNGIADGGVVPAVNHTLAVAPTGGQPLIAYAADLTSFNEQTVYILASGILVPQANQNGLPFGLYLVSPTGGPFIQLMPTALPSAADVQLIHNSADPSLAVVDLYIGPALAHRDFKFRTATQFLPVPTKTSIQLGIAPAGSTSATDIFASTTVTLEKGRYAIVLNGVRDTTAFAPNPSQQSIALSFMKIDNLLPAGLSPTALDMLYMNGCTDCPPVNITHGATRAATGLVYNQAATSYASLEAGPEMVTVTLSDGSTILSVNADVTSLAGQASVVLLSGFLTPSSNGQGAPLGLWVAKTAGGPLQELGSVTSVHEGMSPSVALYPNPTHGQLTITGQPATSTITIVDALGVVQLVANASSTSTIINVATLPAGTYTMQVRDGSMLVSSQRFVRIP